MVRRRQAGKQMRELIAQREQTRGLLVAFEGPDGSGKTTQRKLFQGWLKSDGVSVLRQVELFGAGEARRKGPQSGARFEPSRVLANSRAMVRQNGGRRPAFFHGLGPRRHPWTGTRLVTESIFAALLA